MHPICARIWFYFCVGIFLMPTTATAALPMQNSWKQVSEDCRYVLIMVPPFPTIDEASLLDMNRDTIGAIYPESGLYHNDGTTMPIWTIPYQYPNQEFFIGPEGKHLVIAESSWYGWSGQFGHVVTFYSGGIKLASYNDTDLFSETYLSLPLSGGLECDRVTFDANRMTFTTYSNQGHRFVFDVTTGRQIPQALRVPWGIVAAVVALGIAAISAWWIWPRMAYGGR